MKPFRMKEFRSKLFHGVDLEKIAKNDNAVKDSSDKEDFMKRK